MLNKTLTFNVIINDETDKDGEYFTIDIPDFDLTLGAYGETVDEALDMAKFVIVSEIEEIQQENKKINVPLSYKKVSSLIKSGKQWVVSLSFNYDYEQSLITQVFKNRTVTLPTWLDTLAKNKKLNFSQILQKALKKELKLEKNM